jgi:hypothetical protein
MVHSRTERVFILEHYFSSKSFAAVREAFSDAYPDKKLPNKRTVHRLAKFRKCLSVTSSHRAIKQLELRPYRFKAVHQLQQWITVARIQYFHWFCRFVRELVHV